MTAPIPRSQPEGVTPGAIERMVVDAMETARLEAIEECAKIADQVALNAERRAAGHLPQSAAAEAAYNKMEGAQTVAFQIRERASSVSRPHHSAPEKQPRATIDELERGLGAIIGSEAAHLIRRMIDARELIGTAWEEDVPSPQETDGAVGGPSK